MPDTPVNPRWRRLHSLAVWLFENNLWELFPYPKTIAFRLHGIDDIWFMQTQKARDVFFMMRFVRGWKDFCTLGSYEVQKPCLDAFWLAYECSILQLDCWRWQYLSQQDKTFARAMNYPEDELPAPMFRSFARCIAPGDPTPAERLLLQRLLYGALGICLRADEDASFLERGDGTFFLAEEDAEGKWHDSSWKIPPVPDLTIPMKLSAGFLADFKKLRIKKEEAQCLFSPLVDGNLVHQPRRKSMKYSLVVTWNNGASFWQSEVIDAKKGAECTWGQLPRLFHSFIRAHGYCPSSLFASEERTFNFLQQLQVFQPFKLTRLEFCRDAEIKTFEVSGQEYVEWL